MTMRRVLLVLFAVFVVTLAAPAGQAAVPAHRAAFAVVIGNNRSLGSRRPDLHYADDDAAKYFAILQTVAPDQVSLLADFDDDTARLFPEARVRAVAPTRAELLRVGRELAVRVQAAADAGSETDVYFVFAGHGDVDQGIGFVDLADARFTSLDLEQWLRAIPFSRAHVILDSCTSFFMFGARGPGGRYYATPEDALRSLAARLPNVGVFLSTSAEGESFEWSEIQSGVFSHVVRSGLLGAADADGDGNVSYVELAAFVATATADVANPNMRPHVFSRGPGGRDDQPIIGAHGRTGARTVRLSDAAP
ncbi:MAG TPA: caspase family protein, partial [Polyangiaceae bacterium]|nr:caspase family protein [Polyangiaceae bacterium]